MKKFFLLADDDADDQQLLAEALHIADSNVVLKTTSSAREALQFLQQQRHQPPQLVIVDYNMPDQNGADLLDALRTDPAFSLIPVVVWSTSDSAYYQHICRQKGARHYYRKPEQFSELVALARTMIADASFDQ